MRKNKMLPKTTEDYKYYLFLILGVVTALAVATGLFSLYLKYFLSTNIFDKSIWKYIYFLTVHHRFDLATLWITYVDVLVLVILICYIYVKNPFKLTKRHSNFAKWLDIKKMKPSVLKLDGFSLGVFKNKMLKTNEPLGLLCVAPAGAGKTTGTVIPTILSCDKDSLIINDPKGELFDLTSKYRSKISSVYKLEWGEALEKQDKNTVFWNPIALENLPSTTSDRARLVDMITNILIKEVKGDTFWVNSARKCLSSMLLYSIYKNELNNQSSSISEVKDIIAIIGVIDDNEEEEDSYKDATKEGFKNKAKEVKELNIPEVIKNRCYTVFSELGSTSPNALGSILATVSSDLSVFNNENVRNITSKNSFSIHEIRGKIDKPITVYLISPAAEQELFGVLSGIFVEMCYKFITSENVKEIKNKNILRFVLDEVAFFPKISAVIDGPAIARGYKGSFLFVCQDLSQIASKYDQHGLNTMFTNTAFKIILPQNNDETAKRLANMGGQTQIVEYESHGKGTRKVKKMIPLIQPNDLMSLPEGKQIVFVQNNAKTPIFCDIPYFFKNKSLLKKIK